MVYRGAGEIHRKAGILEQTFGETVADAFGLVFYQNADGKLYRAKADAEATMGGVLYMCMDAATIADEPGNVLAQGRVEKTEWTLTTAGTVYVSETTAGEVTHTPPIAPNIVRPVGIATSAVQLDFRPQWFQQSVYNVDLSIEELGGALGDVLVRGESGWEVLAAAGENQVLTVKNARPSWEFDFVSPYAPVWKSVDTTTIAGFGTTSLKWSGGALGPDGKIYCCPLEANTVLVIDPKTDTVSHIATPSGPKFQGIVAGLNGKLYCIPSDATYVGIIDPVTQTFDSTTISGLPGNEHWIGGVLAPNGKIYCAPFNGTTVLIIDPETDTAENTSITGLAGTSKFVGAVLGSNGKIYCVPYYAEYVLIIDPSDNSVDTTSITGLTYAKGKWHCGCLGYDGKVYFCPRSYTAVGVVDPATNTIDLTTYADITGTSKFAGMLMGPDGCIYMPPENVQYVGIIDIAAESFDSTTIPVLDGTNNKYYGCVLAPNGKLYAIPYLADNCAIISPSFPQYDIPTLLSPYINKV